MSPTEPATGHTLRRIEALTDGIYAVAMTLLVIELKLPERSLLHGSEQMAEALAELTPRLLAWLISFLVLALFWHGNQRAFSFVHKPSGRLLALSLTQLGFVSLMPFSCALSGEYARFLHSQVVYSGNMIVLAVLSLLIYRHIRRYPDAQQMSMPLGVYRGARIRALALILISMVAVGIATVIPAAGNAAFMLMAIVMPISRRIEALPH